jgi:hypothetical protein
MSKKVIAMLVAALFIVALAGALMAAKQPPMKMNGMNMSGMKMMDKMHKSEPSRCSKTCDTLMVNYRKMHSMMKTHEGDKQCWQACWSRYGKGSSASTADMKKLWTSKTAMNMRANQCAQACWRMHNKNSNTVAVAGWKSTPRSQACTK